MFRDPSEDENVGIMQGFMDSLEEMLGGEEDMSEEDDSPSGAPDRTPSSPEILMNTLRGDMRSVDARVDELADMVGYNAASSTPLEVLALLQPVLKQQGIAALPASSAMPPPAAEAPSPAMAPPVSPVPAQGGGIATLPQGDMGQGPPPVAMAEGGEVNPYSSPMFGLANAGPDSFAFANTGPSSMTSPMGGGMTSPMGGMSGNPTGLSDADIYAQRGTSPYQFDMSNPFMGQAAYESQQLAGGGGMGGDIKAAYSSQQLAGAAPYTGLSKYDLFAQGGMPSPMPSPMGGGMDTGVYYGPGGMPTTPMPRPPMGGDMINRMPADYGMPPPTLPSNAYSGVTGITGTASGGMLPSNAPNAYSGPPQSNPLDRGMVGGDMGGYPGAMTSPMTNPMQEMTPGGRPKNPMMAPKPSQFPMGGGQQQPPMRGPQQPPMKKPQQSPMGGGIGALPQGNMGASPKLMAKGGPVQYFQDGSVGEGGVTQVDESSGISNISPTLSNEILSQYMTRLNSEAVSIPDLMQRTNELTPEYQRLLGVNPSATKSQMLFDVAQAALNYAGNVNAQGQPMRGSQAARLAGAASGLPAAIGARAADAQKQNQAIRMAAMQGAQSEIQTAMGARQAQRDAQDALALEVIKGGGTAGSSRTSPISRAYDNGTVLTVLSTPTGPMTRVFDPNGEEVFGADRTGVLRSAREEQVDFAQSKAGATAEGAAVVERNQNAIDIGFDAAMALPTLKRAVTLLDSVKTGGYSAMALKVKQIFGLESADEGELSGLLGKGVLSQLRTTFGAAFTEKEGSRLAGIEARIGTNAQTNRRLLGNAMQIMEFAIDRAISVADDETKGQLQSLRSLTLEDTETTPINVQAPAEGAIAIDRATGSRIKLVNGEWVKI